MYRFIQGLLTLIFIIIAVFGILPDSISAERISDNRDGMIMKTATLEECIQTAIQNNRRRPASHYAVEMAEAKHRQVLAGYWPQVSLQGGYQRMDESSNFIFPSSEIEMPMGSSIPLTIPGVGTVPLTSFSSSISFTS